MVDESSKTRAVRGKDFESSFLTGRVIDIGCGSDLIVPHAEPFDIEDGDAQEIGAVREQSAYDAVVSSHCLEHMRDVPRALDQWWSLVRPGGHLIIVVPDEDLYEQGGWPSLFNRDHKATFRLNKSISWSPVSYDIGALVRALRGAEIVNCELQDHAYDHALRRTRLTRLDRLLFNAERASHYLIRRLGVTRGSVHELVARTFAVIGAPIDQTQGAALAQIQVIVKKRA